MPLSIYIEEDLIHFLIGKLKEPLADRRSPCSGCGCRPIPIDVHVIVITVAIERIASKLF